MLKIVRQDGKDWMFSKDKFVNLELDNLEFLYDEFRDYQTSRLLTLNVVKSLQDVENLPSMLILRDQNLELFTIMLKKCYMRFSEVDKYFDGTIKLIGQKLNRKLNAIDKEKEKLDKSDRSLIERASEVIQDRLKYRNAIRRLESYFGLQ